MLFSQHTACISAIPDSKSSSRATSLALGDVILLISLFNLLRSDLYSLNLARSTAFTPGCKLLASRSIFRIWKQSNQITSFRNKNSNKTPIYYFILFCIKTKRSEISVSNYQTISIIQSSFNLRKLLLLLPCNSNWTTKTQFTKP